MRMRACGVCWAVFTACVVLGACGSDKPPKSRSTGTGGEGEPSGGAPANTSGTSGTSGTSNGGKGSGQVAGADNGAGDSSGGAPVVDTTPGPKRIHFIVDSSQAAHAISPLIYGANMTGLDCGDPKARFTFCRHHSAAWSTYNWENNASNAGQSDCNENNDALSAETTPAAAVTNLIDAADAAGASTVVTVPMLDHVAVDVDADGGAGGDCSGDVSNTSDYLNTRFAQNRPRKGAELALTPDTTDAFVNQDEFIASLKNSHPDSSVLFTLDREPELWKGEHPRVRTTPLTYAEQVSLSTDYSKMIKDNWDGAKVIGLVGYGYLAAVNQQASPDYATEGEFYAYFLKQMAAASQDDGRRLLDYIDLHWFPEIYVDGVRLIDEDASEASVLARVQAPRTLWDPNFVENSWITQSNGGKAIELLTWLKREIDDNYPGTGLSFTEWTYGGGKHISGAIAAADALGIYGQRGVDLAGVISFSPDDEPYLIGAFEAYRNYDGQGATFGDTSVAATSSRVELGSIYASIDEQDPSRMVLVAINRYAYDLNASISVNHDTAYSSVTPYSIVDGQPDPTHGNTVDATAPNEFELTLPPYSVTVLVPNE